MVGSVVGSTANALEAGKPWPLGAYWDGNGVNFAVFSAHAQRLELCLFDASGTQEIACYTLPSHTNDVWHGYLPQATPGLVYGLRAHGTWRPERGYRFNASKLLLDPYAKEIVGTFEWRDEHFDHDRQLPLHPDTRDNAAFALKARLPNDDFDWEQDQLLHHPLASSVIYEVHIKGFSQHNPLVPEALRGTYAGLGHDASIEHLKRLGVTAVSLLPVHLAVNEERLTKLGLHNYWAYNTLGFFCADPRLATKNTNLTPQLSPRDEFRTMVKALHTAGLEVLLDVVFNHTAESDETGPTLSFRGLDNASYYRLPTESLSHYENYSGCGNTLDIRQPRVLQLVLDSLRYWVNDMHVDGFRFDLAPVIGRGEHGFSRDSAFFTAVAQDPLLSRVKMIAEPWDLGPGGYQSGGFPRGWLEWNDHYRDAMRSFWIHGDPNHARHSLNTRGDFALRLCGSSDLYQPRNRAPAESVNYVVSHDGFTLRDLLSYNQRHNLANGENNRDGHGHNLSFNCGVEGPTADAKVNALRGRLQRALLATTLLAQGTPMLCAGDELGHTQQGNNNPYCQDNSTTWIDWAAADEDLIAFTAHVLALRRQWLPLGNHWYSGIVNAAGLHDLAWLNHDGSPLQGHDWQDPNCQVMGCLIGEPGLSPEPLLLLINAEHLDHLFTLPNIPNMPNITKVNWQARLDTTHPRGETQWSSLGEHAYPLAAHSLVLLQAI